MKKRRNEQSPLADEIRETILASEGYGISAEGERLSAIPFHQYMTLCLYHPDFGYYRSGAAARVGREGDFYTSSNVGDIMGEQLAETLSRLALERFGSGNDIDVLDWGGGTGRLSRQMLDAWYPQARSVDRGTLPGADTGEGPGTGGNVFRVAVIEGNPAHRAEAEAALGAYVRDGKARVVADGEGLSPGDRPVIVLANELLDAFPVHRLVMRNGKPKEWGVAWREDRGFVPCLLGEADPRLGGWLAEEGIEPLEGQTLEANLDGAAWAAHIASRFRRAILVFIDYGDESEELFAPHRMDGTLMCYREHRAHHDPYGWPGEQDLTAHVNFTHVRRAVASGGGKEIWYGTQKRFLVESGILAKLSAHAVTDPFHPTVRRNRAIRQLLLSDGMSELFKVQIFSVGD